ncbi:MAG: plasmid pRiA4b ORF-3 family protein [Oscillospiraceae bacterium]|nr:plasmid pRiA4b ORF-3 family protein [Oscillospiraceae bacterium]
MRLECTKRLLDWLDMKPERSSADTDPLFTWTANLITVNRRKTLVAVNPSSRCMFVLYGLTAKSIRILPELIFDGIHAMLQSEHVRPKIIEQYLNDCGKTITFAPNSSRSAVANCNKACERVYLFSNLFAPGDMFQQRFLPWLNDELLPKETYSYAHDIMIAQLKEKYGKDVQSCHAAELEVSLDLHEPCKRTLIVPSNLNFYQLHRVLQDTFEWHDRHLHQFVLERGHHGLPAKIIAPTFEEQAPFGTPFFPTQLNSVETDLLTVFSTHKKLEYEYDFGDGWVHTIKLNRFIEDCPEAYPHCTQAISDAPMEDCGGPDGFAEVMAIMHDSEHPEHRAVCEWVSGIWWNPVDLELINRRIRNEHRICMPVYCE